MGQGKGAAGCEGVGFDDGGRGRWSGVQTKRGGAAGGEAPGDLLFGHAKRAISVPSRWLLLLLLLMLR